MFVPRAMAFASLIRPSEASSGGPWELIHLTEGPVRAPHRGIAAEARTRHTHMPQTHPGTRRRVLGGGWYRTSSYAAFAGVSLRLGGSSEDIKVLHFPRSLTEALLGSHGGAQCGTHFDDEFQ